MFFKKIYRFGDQLEDVVRGFLSHFPIIYAFIGGVGVVVFWRGVWHTTDTIMEYFFVATNTISSTSMSEIPWWDGPLSILIGAIILLMTGIFVSNFIGNEIIISGLKKEKKIAEKTTEEIQADVRFDMEAKREIQEMNIRLKTIEEILKKNKPL